MVRGHSASWDVPDCRRLLFTTCVTLSNLPNFSGPLLSPSVMMGLIIPPTSGDTGWGWGLCADYMSCLLLNKCKVYKAMKEP